MATGHSAGEPSTDSAVRPRRLPLVRGLLLALPGIPDETGYPAAIAGENGGQPSPVCRATGGASRPLALSHVRAPTHGPRAAWP